MILYLIAFILIDLFCFYYLACFNIIYEKSSESWIEGAFMSLAIDLLGMEVGLALIQTTIRSCARKFSKIR